jgi:hypothetical protein
MGKFIVIQQAWDIKESRPGWGDLEREGWGRRFFKKWFAWGK